MLQNIYLIYFKTDFFKANSFFVLIYLKVVNDNLLISN